MRITRVYTEQTLMSGRSIVLSQQASVHLTKVLRLKEGAQVHVFNGHGVECAAEIVAIERHQVTLILQEALKRNVESPIAIHLGLGIARGDKMDFMIQKAVELGVQKITPLMTDHSQISLSTERWKKRAQHWHGVLSSACEQCGRNVLPILQVHQTFTSWLGSLTEETKLLFEPGSQQRLRDLPLATSLVVAIGPEGGFSQEELSVAGKQGFTFATLGPRILRCETAAIASMAALQVLWGDS